MGYIHSAAVFTTDCYLKFYLVLTVAVFGYKGYKLNYNTTLFWLELFLLGVVIVLQYLAIVLSRIDQQRLASLMTIPIVGGLLYFVLWQQHILRPLEIITNSMFISLQAFYGLTCFVK